MFCLFTDPFASATMRPGRRARAFRPRIGPELRCVRLRRRSVRWDRRAPLRAGITDCAGPVEKSFGGMQVEGQSENPDLKRGFDDAIKKGRDALGKK